MRRHTYFLLFLFIFLFIVHSTVVFAATRGIRATSGQGKSLYFYKDYYAMVVGVSNYEKWPKLPNAINDAKEVGKRFEELGFRVKLVLDPTFQQLKTVLSELVYKMGDEENRALLFYYAGHGETETLADKTKMGYIIPRDCPLFKKDPIGFVNHAVSMRDIESVSMRIHSKHVLMLFDSCFSGSLFALVRAVPADITEKSALPVRQYITAGREDEQVPDRSIFKRCLLIGLEGDADLTGDGYVTGSELGMYLSDKVVNYSHSRQHPQYGKINNPDLDRGDFVFVPLKMKEKEKAADKKAQEEKSAIAEELKRLREERKKSEALVEKMKALLEAEQRSKEQDEQSLPEKSAMEERIRRVESEQKARKEVMDTQIKELEARRVKTEEKLRREAEEKRALKAELERLKAEKEKAASMAKALKDKNTKEKRLAAEEKLRMEAEEKRVLKEELERPKAEKEKAAHMVKASKDKQAEVSRLAYVSKEVKDAKIRKIRLRSVPEDVWDSDVEEMIINRNFFEKHLNPKGAFENDFVDNGDGTVSDRATGLMWQKGGSSSELNYRQAKQYIERLNRENFSGHTDWRIPTIEELCSLMEPSLSKKDRHIDIFFDRNQLECWSSDKNMGSPLTDYRIQNHTVNFVKGRIFSAIAEEGEKTYMNILDTQFIKAVRTIE